ncbi:MAG: LLM class flavin-dependent oxidoreductase [Actinomycetia bacterium]|nr:LLM class flavin-dependent oxidoreductase [Actinomycetes bacterium]
MTDGAPDVGVMFRRELAPETLTSFARAVESQGFDEVWLVEDLGWAGGLTSAAHALAITSTIRVGLGVMPAPARNPAFLAMEITTLARLHPGRFLPGIGHGVAHWMDQVGALPDSQLEALESVLVAVRLLAAGQDVTLDRPSARVKDLKLEFPAQWLAPVAAGVRGPRSLELSGRVADGTILAEPASPPYVAWARQQIEAGRTAGDRRDDHRVTVFVLHALDDDSSAAIEALRTPVAGSLMGEASGQLAPLGIEAEVTVLRDQGFDALAAGLQPDWIRALTVAGDPDLCAQAVLALGEAGADSVVLVPVVGEPETAANEFAERVLPLLR